MAYTIKDKLRKKMTSIQNTMHHYQTSLDRSLRYRNICENLRNEKHEFNLAYAKLVDAEVACIRLDEKLSRLIDEYKCLELQLSYEAIA